MKKQEIAAAVVGSLILLGGLIYGVTVIINRLETTKDNTDDILYTM